MLYCNLHFTLHGCWTSIVYYLLSPSIFLGCDSSFNVINITLSIKVMTGFRRNCIIAVLLTQQQLCVSSVCRLLFERVFFFIFLSLSFRLEWINCIRSNLCWILIDVETINQSIVWVDLTDSTLIIQTEVLLFYQLFLNTI